VLGCRDIISVVRDKGKCERTNAYIYIYTTHHMISRSKIYYIIIFVHNIIIHTVIILLIFEIYARINRDIIQDGYIRYHVIFVRVNINRLRRYIARVSYHDNELLFLKKKL